MLLPSLLLACAGSPSPSGQSPIDLHLVVHIDPLVRRGNEPCQDDKLQSCGSFSPEPWRERIDNLTWLSERWVATGRTMDLQWGPEMALVLAEDPAHVANLVAGYAQDGHGDPETAVAGGISQGQAAVQAAVDAGVASFAAHVHTVAPDPSGLWGAGPLPSDSQPHPCDAWAGDPLVEAPLDVVEGIVHYGATGAVAISDRFGVPIRSFTGSVPRVMGNKILALSDPDALDPQVDRDFPAEWAPWLLSGGYSECLMRATGHPPFELYHSSPDRSLGGGDGPLEHPAEPVIGNMAVHLGLPGDGAPGAGMRRLLTAMLSWRYAALTGADDRPWAYGFHTHLFHLYEGTVPADIAEGRDVSAVTGGRFRADTEAVASFADRFAGGPWQGVAASDGGGPVRWGLPGDRDPLAADFVYGDPDAAPPQDMDESYPYLPLVAERLLDANLSCTGQLDDVEVYGLLRCEGEWAWGGETDGFHCADGRAPTWVYVLVPQAATCLQGVEGAMAAASVADQTLGEPRWCDGGLQVPVEGLLLEPAPGSAARIVAACATGLSTGS